MLSKSPVRTTIPVVDLDRAKSFYGTKLGLAPLNASVKDVALFECGSGTCIELYKRAPTKADHTVATFEVGDIEAEVGSLRQKGIVFEEYDMPAAGIRTVDGIATLGSLESAWFKDTEGNILCVHQMKK